MKASWNKIVCIACLGVVAGWATTAAAGPLRGVAKAAVRGAAGGGNGGGVVRGLAGTAAKIAVQQAIPGGNDIKKQLIGAAVEMGVRGGLQAASGLRQHGGLGGLAGGSRATACPSTYTVNRNYFPAGYGEVVVSERVVEPVETVEPAVAEAVESAPAPRTDLKLADVQLVKEGNAQQGPLYRLTVQNVGGSDVTEEITVALLASMEADSNDNVSALGSIDGLKAGETKSVELRLPPGSHVLPHLTAAVAATATADADESDNVATFQR